jgi:alcohol dehydrogenase (NADP+)
MFNHIYPTCALDQRETYGSSSFSMLDIHGCFVIVGLPDELIPSFSAMFLLGNGVSHTSSKKECLQMLQLAADNGVKPRITLLPMSEVKKAVEAVEKSGLKGKSRFVLTQESA